VTSFPLPRHRRAATLAIAMAAVGGLVVGVGTTSSGGSTAPVIFGGVHPNVGNPGDESHEAMDALAQWNDQRTAPAPNGLVDPGAYSAAYTHLTQMPSHTATFTEATTKPYNSDNDNYADQVWSNSKGGSRQVTGRIIGLAVDPTHTGVIYAGGANGGVFRSMNNGSTWTSISDHLPALGVGALLATSDGSLWLGTGEGTTASDAYVGTGVYRLTNPSTGYFTQADRVGSTELESHTVRQLRAIGSYVYAATSRGLYRHLAGSSTGAWQLVLAPCQGVGSAAVACSGGATYKDIANDVASQPGSSLIVAAMGWRGGSGGSTAYNGFYYSTDGTHWTIANPTGGINKEDIGNTTLAYSADGSRLYAVVESVKALLHNQASLLQGVYVSPTGDPNGPWNLAASSSALAASGSVLKSSDKNHGYQPGVQAWYNEFVGVDPTNPMHVYVGLEEVYESWDGGQTWTTTGRYWNFGTRCFSFDPSANTCDGNVMHSDQHAIAFSHWSGQPAQVYVGNDGGAYSRNVATKVGWTDLNASGTLRTLQYYGADVGPVAGGGVALWGGLQDNGQSLLYPGEPTEMVSPVGGDGGIQLVDKSNGCNSLGEYVDLELLRTEACGHTNIDGTPQRVFDIAPGDPFPRFIAPFNQAVNDPDYWVAGGQFVYSNTKTWTSSSGDDWTVLNDNGNIAAGVLHPSTAVSAMKVGSDHVVYSAWCSSNCAPDGFNRGLDTNYGGSWHQVDLDAAGVPNRYISDVYVDPSDSTGGTVYMVLSGYSRKWQGGPGAGQGHVWKTINGGTSWTNLDGLTSTGAYAHTDSFPDVPTNQIRIAPNGDLVVSTDLGVVVHPAGTATGHWERLGLTNALANGNLPFVPTVSVAWGGGDGLAYVATHGRGIWTVPASAL
jgi:hypothetical protein